jgi:hypothetical protein
MNAFLERLAEEGAKMILEAIGVGVLTLGAAVFARNLVRRGKVRVGRDSGRTGMSPYVLLVGLLCAVAAAVFLALGLVFPHTWREPGAFNAWLGLVMGFSLGFLAILPFTRHTWEWDEAGLRWHGAWRSASMRWPEIARLGKSSDGQFFAADKTGKRICWSTYTLEHEALRRAIQKARPDLTLPE